MVFEKLKEVLVEEIGVSPEEVTMDSNMVTDIGADSLDIVQLLKKWKKNTDLSSPTKR